MSETTHALRAACGHDSRSEPGCLNCEAADLIEGLRAEVNALRAALRKAEWHFRDVGLVSCANAARAALKEDK